MKRQLLWFAGLFCVAAFAAPLRTNAQPTQADYNYIGIGGSNEGIAVNSKIQIADRVSIRPTAIADIDFDDDLEVSGFVPITYDFAPSSEAGRLLPFAGAGVAASTRDNGEVGAVVTGGVDYRINQKLTANGSVYWTPFNDSKVDFVVGLGYSF